MTTATTVSPNTREPQLLGQTVGGSVATSGDIRDQPKGADAASELRQEVFGKEKSPCRLVYGVASLPLGTPDELEVIFGVAA
jgi:hypothetical protein